MWMFFTKAMMLLHMFVGVILIGIILLQRGRGGGLAGAFGGMGGQSAFGTKAGDVFTKITIYIATFWIVLGCVCVVLASNYKASKPQIFKPGMAADIKKAPAADADAENKSDGDESAMPQPNNPPVGKTETEAKADGETPKDQAKPADGDQPAPPAAKEGDSTDKKPETKPSEPSEPPANSNENKTDSKEKQPD